MFEDLQHTDGKIAISFVYVWSILLIVDTFKSSVKESISKDRVETVGKQAPSEKIKIRMAYVQLKTYKQKKVARKVFEKGVQKYLEKRKEKTYLQQRIELRISRMRASQPNIAIPNGQA